MTAELNLSQYPRRVQELFRHVQWVYYGEIVEVSREKGDYYVIVVKREGDAGYWEGEYYVPDPWTEHDLVIAKYLGRQHPVEVCWDEIGW